MPAENETDRSEARWAVVMACMWTAFAAILAGFAVATGVWPLLGCAAFSVWPVHLYYLCWRDTKQ